MVNEKHQIIVNAEAHGEGQEPHLLKPTIEQIRKEFQTAEICPDIFKQAQVVTDAGYHSKQSVSYMEEQGIDAYMTDRSYRQRDRAFSDYGRYKVRFQRASVVIMVSILSGLRPRTSYTMIRIEAVVVLRAIDFTGTALISRFVGLSL